ncbi:hypothetical protein [Burkholderia sp. BE17]|uniref:hypothetical protein n=1 Tax=Burkholderia sp. BE17 TaxID=2656644 RepID=UPI00128B9A5D|nr:hypothetical protein [Burkholderia sp. BE17]MPV69464.1 hypothetical protein [Burkholderia sp. BE17]
MATLSETEIAIHHLLNVWRKFDPHPSSDTILVHRNEPSVEAAAAFLEIAGYGDDWGFEFVLNQRGIELMNAEI